MLSFKSSFGMCFLFLGYPERHQVVLIKDIRIQWDIMYPIYLDLHTNISYWYQNGDKWIKGFYWTMQEDNITKRKLINAMAKSKTCLQGRIESFLIANVCTHACTPRDAHSHWGLYASCFIDIKWYVCKWKKVLKILFSLIFQDLKIIFQLCPFHYKRMILVLIQWILWYLEYFGTADQKKIVIWC